MLELIFQGFLEWGYGLILECWQYFSSALLDVMSMDFAYLKSHIPILDDIMQLLMAVGWALLIGNLVFQSLKSMASGLGFEGEDPKLLFTRTFVFSFLLLASPQICEIGLSMTSKIIDLLQMPDAVNVQLVDESVFGSLSAAWLLVIIFGIVIIFKIFKLLLEIAERYVILAVLTITAPLAFSMGGSKSTSDIFTGWCRMFGSMCLLMVTNVIFFKMLLSVLSTVPSGLDVLAWMVLILTIVKVAHKSDAIITRIGLNPAITGDSLGRMFPGALSYMVVRTVASHITKAVGKSTGNSGKGRSPGTPPGSSGGPRMGGPVGGRSGASASAYAQQTASQQTTSRQSSTRQGAVQQTTAQSAAYQSNSSQVGGQQTTTQEHTAGSIYQGGPQMGQSASKAAQERKTSVPPGARRSPAHVKTQTATPPVGATAANGRPGAAGKIHTTAKADGAASAVTASHARRETVSSHRAASPDAAGAVRPGTAGTAAAPSASRMTQMNTQRVQERNITGAAQTAERTGITISQTTQNGAPVASPSHRNTVKTPVPSVLANGQSSQTGSAATRFTQRPAQMTSKPTGVAASDSNTPRQSSSNRENSQHGPAGKMPTASATPTTNAPRPGRNGVSAMTTPTETRQHNPIRQESRTASVDIKPTVKSGTPIAHPGPAGTAAERQPPQTRQTMRGTASPSTASGSPGGKKSVADGTAAIKGSGGAKSAGQPARKQRGKRQ